MKNLIIKIAIIIIVLINSSLIYGGDTMLPGTEKLARKTIQAVDIVKLVLYKVVTDDYSVKYKSKGEDYYKNLAGATVNEIFNDHSEMSLKVFNENKEIIINGIKNIGENHPDLKRPITDALRVFSQVNFMLSGEFSESSFETFNKAIDRNIFIEGGEAPESISFLEMADNLAKTYGISRNSDDKYTTNDEFPDKTKWTEKIKSEFLQGCIGNIPISGMSNENAQDYCSCVLEKTMENYPEPEDINGQLPWDFVVKTGVDCAERIETFDTTENNSFNSDKIRFLFSVVAFRKAFELEPLVETDDQQNEYESLIKIGVNLGYNVNSDFLNNLHPELLNRYRNDLIKGGELLLDGNANNDDISLALQKLSDGAELANKFGTW